MAEDTTYFAKVDATKKAKIKLVVDKLNSLGLTNKFIQAGILAVISKESDFVLREEASYRKTAASRIREVFSVFKKWTDADIDTLKVDDKKFFDTVYGGKYGNAKDEGYKYRGRGLNQITFKNNYKTYGAMAQVNIVDNPDKLSEMDVAAAVCAAYFIDHLVHASSAGKASYHFEGINDFKNTEDAVNAAYNSNAGWGKTYQDIKADKTGGYAKACSRVNGFYNMIVAGL
jgi:predicted chitinase